MSTRSLIFILISFCFLLKLPAQSIGKAPFSELRWFGDIPEIKVNGTWYEWETANRERIKDFFYKVKKEDTRHWKESFAAEITEILKKKKVFRGDTLSLGVRSTKSGKQMTLHGVEITRNKWLNAVYHSEYVQCRNSRQHTRPIPPELAFLKTRADGYSPPDTSIKGTGFYHNPVRKLRLLYNDEDEKVYPEDEMHWLSTIEASEDLDQLEWILTNDYAYLDYYGIDYQLALDAIRSDLKGGISRLDFAVQVAKVLGMFGDTHAKIDNLSSIMRDRTSRIYTPFDLVPFQGKIIALDRRNQTPVAPGCPFLVSINGAKIETWLKNSRQLLTGGSEATQAIKSADKLEKLGFWIYLATGKIEKEATFTFADATGKTITQKMELLKRKSGESEDVDYEILLEDIGYLQIKDMNDHEDWFDDLAEFMEDIRDANGLIIDLRGNSGGNYDYLRYFFPFFFDFEGPTPIITVGAQRIDKSRDHHPEKGYLDSRYLYPPNYKKFSQKVQIQIQELAQNFKPEWELPKDKFSDWHYLAVRVPSSSDEYFYFDKPVVLLQDGKCYSATEVFLNAFQGRPNTTIMGTPTMGGSGAPSKTTLFHSQLEVKVPRMAAFRTNGQLYEQKGIQPDIPYQPTLSDLTGETDGLLDLAKSHILKAGK